MPRNAYKPRSRKYRNTPTGGYASKRESVRAQELKLLEKAGEITNLIDQPKYLLIPKQDGERPCYYVGDFEYIDARTGAKIVEDCKGMKTQVYRIKKKLLLQVHGIRILETQ